VPREINTIIDDFDFSFDLTQKIYKRFRKLSPARKLGTLASWSSSTREHGSGQSVSGKRAGCEFFVADVPVLRMICRIPRPYSFASMPACSILLK
jgi:hypothetical protein